MKSKIQAYLAILFLSGLLCVPLGLLVACGDSTLRKRYSSSKLEEDLRAIEEKEALGPADMELLRLHIKRLQAKDSNKLSKRRYLDLVREIKTQQQSYVQSLAPLRRVVPLSCVSKRFQKGKMFSHNLLRIRMRNTCDTSLVLLTGYYRLKDHLGRFLRDFPLRYADTLASGDTTSFEIAHPYQAFNKQDNYIKGATLSMLQMTWLPDSLLLANGEILAP